MRDLYHAKRKKIKREAALSETPCWVRIVRTTARIVRVSGVSGHFTRSIQVPFSQRLFSRVWGINTPLTPSLTLSLAHFEPEQDLTLEQALSLPPL